MIGAVHAIIGACIGSFTRSKAGAFAAGVVSHAVADSLPHKDLDPKLEVPLAITATLAIAGLRGTDSPEFWGAIGAMSPDLEHGLSIAYITEPHQKVFPTHIHDGKYHGRKSDERVSQLLIVAAALAVLAVNGCASDRK